MESMDSATKCNSIHERLAWRICMSISLIHIHQGNSVSTSQPIAISFCFLSLSLYKRYVERVVRVLIVLHDFLFVFVTLSQSFIWLLRDSHPRPIITVIECVYECVFTFLFQVRYGKTRITLQLTILSQS